jgi:hypothetical protein
MKEDTRKKKMFNFDYRNVCHHSLGTCSQPVAEYLLVRSSI